MANEAIYMDTEEVYNCVAEIKNNRDGLERLIGEITKIVNGTTSIYTGDAAEEMRKRYKNSFLVNAEAYIKQLDEYIKFATDAKLRMEEVEKQLQKILDEKGKKFAAEAVASVTDMVTGAINNLKGWK
ncbi:MAG: hypothetical protein NC240_09185 [Clostridium sp.]|nr:hypothetical protein [Clostridium sp.]